MTSRCAAVILCLCWCVPTDPAAQDRLARVRYLFAAASYEEALALLDTLDSASHADSVATAEYRILCLLALGRSDQARFFIEQLVLDSPRRRLDPSMASPRIQATFDTIKRELLPGLIAREFAAAKASFDARDFKAAVTRFDRLILLLDQAGDDARVASLRKSALAFRDLARAAVPADAAMPANDGGKSSAETVIYDRHSREIVPPAALKQVLPQAPRASASGNKSGVLEIVIDERGRVESATMRRSLTPEFDAVLLREAGKWQYVPARTREGKAVKFRKLIEIYSSAP